MDNTLYIRSDGNAQIGLGHVMRCLSIAMAARTMGYGCVFITADDDCRALIERHGFSTHVLHSTWNCLDSELPALCAYLDQRRAQQLLIDSYFVTEAYMRLLCEKIKIAYLDDVSAFVYPCHTLINYNVYAKSFYKSSDYTSTQMLLGSEFAPLRPEFQGLQIRKTRPTVSRILITTGSSDSYGMLPCLIAQILADSALNNLILYIIIGRFHQYRTQLENLTKKHPNLQIYVDTNQMAALMQQCDLAVSAGGSTLYELCACSLPSVCFSLADNQLEIVKWFDNQKLIAYAGDVRDGTSQCAECICNLMKKYLYDVDLRTQHATYLYQIVRGNGAQKIVCELLNSDKSKLQLNIGK